MVDLGIPPSVGRPVGLERTSYWYWVRTSASLAFRSALLWWAVGPYAGTAGWDYLSLASQGPWDNTHAGARAHTHTLYR